MTSKIIVNNVGSDTGINTVTFDSNVQRGSSNLHSTGLNVNDTFVHSTGIALGAGSTIGAVTGVTTYYGDGSQLTGISAGPTLTNGDNNRIVTATGANALNAQANLTYNGATITHNVTGGLAKLDIKGSVGGGALGASISLRNTNTANNGKTEIQFQDPGSNVYAKIEGTSLTDGSNNGEIRFYTASATQGVTERLKITQEGYVLKSETPCFDAVRSGGNVSAGNIIHYNTVNVNNGNHYNSSNGRFTAPVAGFYFFSYGTIKNGTNNVTRLHIYKNGSRIYNAGRHLRMDSDQNYGDNGAMTIVVSLAVNDYISIKVEEGEAYGTTQEYCYFNGFLIG